jgi:hypothetical protein
MSDTQEEISTTPLPGVTSAAPGTSSSTQSPLVASLLALPLFAKPLTALALLGMAWVQVLPRLWDSIQLAEKSCGSDWKPWIGPLIWAGIALSCINPKTIRDAGGLVGAATSFVGAVRGAAKPKA